jgi:hypothetical protein
MTSCCTCQARYSRTPSRLSSLKCEAEGGPRPPFRSRLQVNAALCGDRLIPTSGTVRFFTATACHAHLLTLLASIACATPDEPVAPACPVPNLDTREWREVRIENAGAIIRMPPDARTRLSASPMPEVWSMERPDRSSVLAFISEDWDQAPAWVEGIPLPSWRAGRSRCEEHIAAIPARFQAYFERWGNLVVGRYVATGAYEIVPASWLVIAGVSSTSRRQREVLAALRTVRFLPPAGSAARPPAPPCTVRGTHASEWPEYQALSGLITFRAPAGSAMDSDYGRQIWSIGPTRVDFELLGTRSWILESPPGSMWCSLTVDGHYAEVRLAQSELGNARPNEYEGATAYVQISPTHVLNVFAYIYGDPAAPERFFSLLRSVRIGSVSPDPPHN